MRQVLTWGRDIHCFHFSMVCCKDDTLTSVCETLLSEALGLLSEIFEFCVLYSILPLVAIKVRVCLSPKDVDIICIHHLINEGVHRQVTGYGKVDRSQAEDGSLGTHDSFPIKSVGSKEVGTPSLKMQLKVKSLFPSTPCLYPMLMIFSYECTCININGTQKNLVPFVLQKWDYKICTFVHFFSSLTTCLRALLLELIGIIPFKILILIVT